MAEANRTLKRILSLIDKDVNLIKKNNKSKQLAVEDALTLSRYAGTLNSLIDGEWDAKEKLKKRYEKMKTEDLIKMHNDRNKKVATK